MEEKKSVPCCSNCAHFSPLECVGKGLCKAHDRGVSAQDSCAEYKFNQKSVETASRARRVVASESVSVPKSKPRKGMRILAGIFYAMALPYVGMISSDSEMLMAALFFGIFGVMFSVLARSPKYNKYILGKSKGITKKLFVIFCIAIAFLTIVVAGS